MEIGKEIQNPATGTVFRWDGESLVPVSETDVGSKFKPASLDAVSSDVVPEDIIETETEEELRDGLGGESLFAKYPAVMGAVHLGKLGSGVAEGIGRAWERGSEGLPGAADVGTGFTNIPKHFMEILGDMKNLAVGLYT